MNQSFVSGMKAGIPVALSLLTSFVATGMLLAQAGYDVTQATVMTAVVFAGPAQLMLAQGLASASGFLTAALLTFLINLRFFVMATSLIEPFRKVSLGKVLTVVPLLSASTYTVTQSSGEIQDADSKFRFFVGLGLVSYVASILGTLLGASALSILPQISVPWLSMILPLYFCSLIGAQKKVPSNFWAFAFGIVGTVLLKEKLGSHALPLVSVAICLISFGLGGREKE